MGATSFPPTRISSSSTSRREAGVGNGCFHIADSGHYPMQETPPLTAAILQRFLGRE